MFVTDIIAKGNQVVLGSEEDIFKTELIAKDTNFIPFDNLKDEINVEAKIRYSAKPSKAKVSPMDNGKVKVTFEEKVRAITKGQSVVFYNGDVVVGGGVIEEIL